MDAVRPEEVDLPFDPLDVVEHVLTAENLPFVAEYATEVKLRDAMQPLLNDAALRAQVGAANQAKARAEYDEGVMIARYAALYEEAMGRPGVLRG